ncbi:ABC transporter ATP-binding protein [Streptomyces anthocyanicus]|uniref:Peptide ABC transporter ATP-binding protein n=2 Tax=Streptomyces TaxID=1883 RepID=A0A7U9HFN6_STRLI|nr:peptide ABC transporter ATP-binding protein [Streptomyces lividans 1326]BDE43509.1 ABC transporter ATP-binding protein [Streptomyces lividans]GGL67646.1 ABC transporter ATP-binding protein [Streptomyces anthocyanicus]GHC29150.1 ABC transporter ATP-binding protein [Streptomyces anthocyanicus]
MPVRPTTTLCAPAASADLGRVVEEGGTAEVSGASRHPYAEAPLSATRSLRERPGRIVPHGPVPSATRPPSGCPFRTRCWKADDACATVFPAAAEAQADGYRPARAGACVSGHAPSGRRAALRPADTRMVP